MATRRSSSRLPHVSEHAAPSTPAACATGVAIASPTPREALPDATPADLSERLVAAAPYAMLALNVETQRIVLANRAARQLLASMSDGSGEPLEGQTLEAALPYARERGVLAHLDLAVRTGEAFTGLALEIPSVVGGAATYWVYDIVPLDPTSATAATLLLTFRDVTEERLERQRAEHRTFSAQLYAERLEAILEQLSEAVIIRDTDGMLLAYNRAALAFARNRRSVERARARGARLEPRWALLSPEGVPVSDIEQPAFRAMLTGAPMTGGQYVLRGEGKRVTPVLAHAAPLRDESGVITGAVVAFQDITAVKEVERLRDEFLSVASHELRQPLTVISGQAQMLKRHLRKMASGDARRPLTLETLQSVADGVEAQTLRLNLLVSDLLDMSRIQAGQLKLVPAQTRLVALVKRMVDSQHQSTLDHEFRVTVDLPPGENELLGVWDSQRIEQILLNLLGNAVKYSPHGGRISIRVARAPQGSLSASAQRARSARIESPAALVAITDEGIGIPEDALAHLFERFYRARNTGGIQGTGLGLYICRQLAWAHGGDLWVESRGIGSGSTFNLALPLAEVRS